MRRLFVSLVAAALLAAPAGAQAPQQAPATPPATPPPRVRLFPPEQLGMLERPDRDDWQQPDRIMDALSIADGAKVADIGAGSGWFTVRLARRVGPNGVVYAEDIQPPMIESIKRRVESEGLSNVTTQIGTPTDPRLPDDTLEAALVVDLYAQLGDPVGLLRHVRDALAPNGRLGIVDFRKDGYGPGPTLDERVDPAAIVRDAERAGLRLARRDDFLRYQYLLVFAK